MSKKILITGSSGLVGSAFKQITSQYNNYEFIYSTSETCNLVNYEETFAFFNKIKPNYVIHLAANVGGLYKNMNYKVDILEKNLLINFNVLKCCYSINVEKCICMLSTCIFPDDTTYPIDETMLHKGPPHDSNYAYAYAKRIMEVHCRSYNEQYKTNFSCIIPTNIYGPNDNFSLEDGHVIPSLIHKCYLAKVTGIPFEVRGTGKPLRQFIYSEDLAKIIMELLDQLNCENLIISPNEEYSISDVSVLIAKEFDYDNNMVFNDNYSDGQFKKTANNIKMISYISEKDINFEFTTIQEGIKTTVDFFKKNIDNCRK
jgi:GDP-L-fucose synthase